MPVSHFSDEFDEHVDNGGALHIHGRLNGRNLGLSVPLELFLLLRRARRVLYISINHVSSISRLAMKGIPKGEIKRDIEFYLPVQFLELS